MTLTVMKHAFSMLQAFHLDGTSIYVLNLQFIEVFLHELLNHMVWNPDIKSNTGLKTNDYNKDLI